jgi:hypothetical protein
MHPTAELQKYMKQKLTGLRETGPQLLLKTSTLLSQ